jgi:hypothetical protein
MHQALAGDAGRGRIDLRFAAMLALCVGLAILLWTTPLLLPFRLFVTMVHEVSHALVGVATGGQVLGIAISLDGSGVTRLRGGNLFLTASAGYVGSGLFGAGLLLLARERRWRRPLLQVLAVGLVIATVVFFREPTGIIAALLLAGMFWLFAARGPDWLVALLVYLLAVLNGLYALIDLLTLLQLSGPAAAAATDAATLQRLTGIPALFWALLWTAMAAAVQFFALRYCLTSAAAPRLRAAAGA